MITKRISKTICLLGTSNKGFALMLPIIIMISVFVVFVFSLSLALSTLSSANYFLLDSKRAWGAAEACAESALLMIRNNSSYTGSLNLNLDSAACSATTIDIPGYKQISVTASSHNVYKRLSISATYSSGRAVVASWSEVQSF